MTYFYEYMVDTLRVLGGLRSGTASAGSTTSLTDTTNRLEMEDYWNGGTVFVLSANNQPPQGEFSRVADFGSGVLAFKALSAAVEAGDGYVVSPGHYPWDVLVDCLNLAMKQYRYPQMEYTGLQVAAGQTEYELPEGVRFGRLKEVYVETHQQAADHRWQKVGEWWTVDDTAKKLLILPEDLVADYLGSKLRLDYEAVHTDYTTGSQVVHEILEPKYVIFRAAEFMLLQQMYDGDEWPYLEARMNYFMAKADLYEAEFIEKIHPHRRE